MWWATEAFSWMINLSATSPAHLDFKCHSHCARSYSLRARKPGDSLTDKKHTGSNSTLPQSLTDVSDFLVLIFLQGT